MIKRCTRKTESGVIWLLAFLQRAKARGFPARDSDEHQRRVIHTQRPESRDSWFSKPVLQRDGRDIPQSDH